MAVVRIEVSTADLLRAFADVKPFAGKDDTLPMLCAVQLEFGGNDLHLITTDRYTMGVARLPVGAEQVQPLRLVRTSDVERIEKAFRAPKGTNPALALEFGEDGLAVETTATLDGEPTQRLAVPWLEATGRAWRTILAEAEKNTEVGVAAFNPAFLAKFAQLQRDEEPVTVYPGPANRPWRVTVGDHFVGLIMPQRDPNAARWSPAAANVAPAPKKRAPRKASQRKEAKTA